MAAQRHQDIPMSMLSANYLKTNATSHTWPFGAVAELIDNAYDPDVNAKKLLINVEPIRGSECLTFTDNGNGMDSDTIHKMLSFGFSDKKTINGHVPVGLYGNGFKSGSMRLGKDAIVFTKNGTTMCVGLLSQSYLENIKAKQIVLPIITYCQKSRRKKDQSKASLNAIMKHSLFCTDWELLEQLDAITGEHGTRVIIWNLRKTFNGQTEFDFDEDENDIRILVDIMNTPCKTQKTKVTLEQSEPQCKSSLRAYCSILYLEPRMEIILRGQKVITQLFSKSLSNIEKYTYKPRFLTIEKIPITFGKNAENMEQYGIMMYHKNRLIKAYERVGCQRKAGNTGVGVIGIIECNYLKTAHNKQDFDSSSEYSNTMKSLDRKVLHYWQKYCGNSSTNCPSRRILIQETHEEIHTQMRTRGQENNGLPVITSYYSLAPKRGKYISIMAPESSKSKKAKEDDTHNAVECLDATPCSSNSTDSPPRPHCSSMASQTEVRSPIKQESLSERKLICQMQDLKMTFQELTEMRRVQFQMLEKNKPDAGRSQAAGSLSDVGRREAEKPQELLQEVEKQWKVLEAAKKHFKATMTNWTS